MLVIHSLSTSETHAIAGVTIQGDRTANAGTLAYLLTKIATDILAEHDTLMYMPAEQMERIKQAVEETVQETDVRYYCLLYTANPAEYYGGTLTFHVSREADRTPAKGAACLHRDDLIEKAV